MTALPAGLRMLLWLQFTARMRRIAQQARTPRGAVMSLFGVLLVVLWLAPSLMAALYREPANLELSRAVFPVMLLLFTLLGVFSSAGERALYFSPSEIEFLFQAPYTRRQILMYRIVSRNMSLFLVALIFSVFLMRACALWPAAYLGALLGLIFLNLAATIIALASEYVAERAYSTARRLIVGLVMATLVFGFVRGINLTNSADAFDALLQVGRHPAMQVVLAPFQPLARTFTAADYGELLFWAPVALAINLALFGCVIALDARYEDKAVALSEKLYARSQRAKSSGGFAAANATARFGLPMLPRMGGAGVIVWMQLTHALRAGRTIALVMLPVLFMLAMIVFMTRESSRGEAVGAGAAAMMCFYLSVFFPNVFRFDFRSHIDNMDTLKAMPLGAMAVAAGQLAVPVAVTTLAQLLLLGAAALLTGSGSPYWLLGMAVLLPVNLVIYAVENAIFLLYPVRLASTGPGDMQFLGRQVMLIFMKLAILLVAVAMAAAGGAAAYFVFGRNVWAGGALAITVLTALALCLVPVVAETYRRFDPSQHTPA